MADKLYKILLSFFIAYILILNIVTSLASGSASQLFNFGNIRQRSLASYYLIKHVIFESGVFIKKMPSYEKELLIKSMSGKYHIDSRLIHAMSYNGSYYINRDGGMGIIGVKIHMMEDCDGKDPFLAEDNLYIGLNYLRRIIDEESDLLHALNVYYDNYETASAIYDIYLKSSDI